MGQTVLSSSADRHGASPSCAAPGPDGDGDGRSEPLRLRRSRQLEAVLAELDQTDDFLTAQQIYDRMRKRGHGIGLSTVYRTMHGLCVRGEVDAVYTDRGEQVFRRCRTEEHHHYVICRSCGLGIEVFSPPLEQLAAALIRAHGFTNDDHRIELYGKCPRCVSTASHSSP